MSFRVPLIVLCCCLFSCEAFAHRFAPSLLKIVETTDQHYNVVWKTPAQRSSNVPITPVWPELCEVVSESPAVSEGTGIVINSTLHCDFGLEGMVGHSIGITGLLENQSSAMVMLSLKDGRHYQQVLNNTVTTFQVPVEPGDAQVAIEYPLLGIEHIWGGPDHLLFVLGLLILVGGGMGLLWTITAFTVGHSITLAMVTLGVFGFSVPLIEFAIALSIFVLALELSVKKHAEQGRWRHLLRSHPWWLAGGFGLLHGMGFAGALSEIGLPQDNVPMALLFFNIGIEIGQILFVCCALLMWWGVSRLTDVTRLLPIPVYIIGSLSAMWCIERGLLIVS